MKIWVRLTGYLNDIEESDIATLELGDYPAIEALAFAAIEVRRRRDEIVLTKAELGEPPGLMII